MTITVQTPRESVAQATAYAIVFAIAGGCTTPAVEAHSASAEQHREDARQHENAAAAHESLFDPRADERRRRCYGGGSLASEGPACWTAITNPTDEHRREAEEHRRVAAQHRAASAVLAEAEKRACSRVPEEDRELSPFERVEDIAAVETIQSSGNVAPVRITFRPLPGLSAWWLQQVVDCHIARNAALGHVAPEMRDCPLVPPGVVARVSNVGASVRVDVTSDDPLAAREVYERALRIRARLTPTTKE